MREISLKILTSGLCLAVHEALVFCSIVWHVLSTVSNSQLLTIKSLSRASKRQGLSKLKAAWQSYPDFALK